MSGGIFQVFRWPRFKLRQTVAYISNLFSAGEPGAWYDPSDMSTLFQDAAGTTPVTAVEQPVGLMLDLSGRGNHATQATTTKRPVLSRRVNRLIKTEDISARTWEMNDTTTQRLADKSGMAVYKIIGNNAISLPKSIQQTHMAPAGSKIYMSAIVKAAGCNCAYIAIGASRATAIFNLVTGQIVTAYANNIYYASPFASITPLNDGEFKITFTVTAVSDVGSRRFGPAIDGNLEYTGDGASGITIRAATMLDGITDAHLPYQWVNTATDYDADPSKFPAYLRFDGVDDAMQTGNIDFTGTDKMTVWAGVCFTNIAGGGQTIANHNGTAWNIGFWVNNPNPVNGFLRSSASGNNPDSAAATSSVDRSGPMYLVITGAHDYTGPHSIRVNSVSEGSVVKSLSGRPGNGVVSIGSVAGVQYFNGRLYSLIVRGAQTPLSQIEATERYIKTKMRMP